MIMKYKAFKVMSKSEMKKVMGGSAPTSSCSANCNPGFVSIDSCSGTCKATDEEGVKCGDVKKCCFGGQSCNP